MDGAVPGGSARPDALAAAALLLARRFAAGATMWCVAPGAPEHARHVAVEFVHPVIVGKRALPAVAVAGPEPVAALRAAARAGDVVLVGREPAPTTSVVDVAAARPGVGADDDLGRRRATGRAARPHHVAVDRRRRRAAAVRRAARARLPPAVGAHPRVLRAPGPAAPTDGACDGRRSASPARTRAAWPRWSRVDGAGDADGAHRPRRRGGRLDAGRRRSAPGDLVLVHAGTALVDWWPEPRDDRLPLSVHRGRRAATPTRCSPTSPRRPRPRREERRALAGRDPRARRRRARPRPPPPWPTRFAAGGRLFTFGNGGQLDRRRRRWPRCSPTRRAAAPLPARCLADDEAVLTALGNDVGFELVFSRQLIAHARPGDIALGLLDQRQLAEPARGVRRGPRAGHPDDRAGRLRRRARWATAGLDHCLVVRVGQRAPHPGDPGGARASPSGGRVQTALDRRGAARG